MRLKTDLEKYILEMRKKPKDMRFVMWGATILAIRAMQRDLKRHVSASSPVGKSGKKYLFVETIEKYLERGLK